MGEETSGLAVPWFRSLRPNLCPHFSGFLLDHSGALLQVADVFLDPAVSRIDTDVSALSGEEAVERADIVQRMSRDGFDHLWPLHPCGICGDNLRPPPFCCPFLSSLSSTSGHTLPGSLQPSSHQETAQ